MLSAHPKSTMNTLLADLVSDVYLPMPVRSVGGAPFSKGFFSSPNLKIGMYRELGLHQQSPSVHSQENCTVRIKSQRGVC